MTAAVGWLAAAVGELTDGGRCERGGRRFLAQFQSRKKAERWQRQTFEAARQ